MYELNYKYESNNQENVLNDYNGIWQIYEDLTSIIFKPIRKSAIFTTNPHHIFFNTYFWKDTSEQIDEEQKGFWDEVVIMIQHHSAKFGNKRRKHKKVRRQR
jgi:hypothetical protein